MAHKRLPAVLPTPVLLYPPTSTMRLANLTHCSRCKPRAPNPNFRGPRVVSLARSSPHYNLDVRHSNQGKSTKNESQAHTGIQTVVCEYVLPPNQKSGPDRRCGAPDARHSPDTHDAAITPVTISSLCSLCLLWPLPPRIRMRPRRFLAVTLCVTIHIQRMGARGSAAKEWQEQKGV